MLSEQDVNRAITPISIVILTYNRLDSLRELLKEIATLKYPSLEVIVVDNCSEKPASALASEFKDVIFLLSPGNIGTGGRNIGMAHATGDIMVCLDDDVGGLSDAALWKLAELFVDKSLGGICFKIIEAQTGKITNWNHHVDMARFSERRFDTYEITEGAVALRREVAAAAGYYPESFFISHEGTELGFRILDLGYRIEYNPSIVVIHAYSPFGRTSWRNYYFDTRNTFWLVIRNCLPLHGARMVIRQAGSMLLYSVRDGFFLWWFRGVWDGLTGIPSAWRERKRMSRETYRRIALIDRDRPNVFSLLRKRLFQRGIKI